MSNFHVFVNNFDDFNKMQPNFSFRKFNLIIWNHHRNHNLYNFHYFQRDSFHHNFYNVCVILGFNFKIRIYVVFIHNLALLDNIHFDRNEIYFNLGNFFKVSNYLYKVSYRHTH